LLTRVNRISCIENIKELTEELMPQIREFGETIDSFEADNEDVRECIRKFDETISNKVSKATF